MLAQPDTTADTRSFLNRLKADVRQNGLSIDKNAAQELQQKIENALPDVQQMQGQPQNQQDLTAQNRETPVTDHANTTKTINLTLAQVEHNVQSGIQTNAEANPKGVQKAMINCLMRLETIETLMQRQSQNINHQGVDISRVHEAYVNYFFEGGDLQASAQEAAAGIRDVIATGKLKSADVELLTGAVAEMVGSSELAEAYVSGPEDASRVLPNDSKTLIMDEGLDNKYNNKNEKESDATYERPSHFRKGIRKITWEQAVSESEDGIVKSPSGDVINEKENWQMGHKPGYEFRKHQASAERRGISRKEFLDEYNEPMHYRPELPKDNLSHKYEGPDEINYWDLF